MEYYSAIRKKEILPLATTWTELESNTQTETRQTEKPNNRIVSLTHGILKKNKIKHIETESRKVVARG